MLENYFKQYLDQSLHLSSRSVDHYISAIRILGGLIKKDDNEDYNFFCANSISEAEAIIAALKESPEFIKKNTSGNHMYGAALNHFQKFLSLDNILPETSEISIMDIKRSKPDILNVSSASWTRNSIMKEQVIRAAEYRCEIDQTHCSFISSATGYPYMEGHHIIPMRFQSNFNCSLDIYANIICLCPNCHRLLHYGMNSVKKKILTGIYEKRCIRLKNSGIDIQREKFIELASQ